MTWMMVGTEEKTRSVAAGSKSPVERGSALTTPLLAASGTSLAADWRVSNLASAKDFARWGRSKAIIPAVPSATSANVSKISLWETDKLLGKGVAQR